MGGIFSKPKMPPPPKPVEMPRAPVVEQAIIDRDQGDMLKRRRGRAATMLEGSSGMIETGSVASKSLLGG